jgi:hypothetical protein
LGSHKEWIQGIEAMKRRVDTPEGIRYALVSLREQRGCVDRYDEEEAKVLEDAIKYFESKLRGAL